MLSYQHAYHAGNLADVHKHALLAVMLARMAAKDKPLTYVETHAGRGLYDLGSPEALKTGEAAAGIARAGREGWFAADHPYARALAAVRATHGSRAYPGSPLIAAHLLRPGDRVVLAELHPKERAALEAAMAADAPARVNIRAEDGLAMARAVTPPTPRRGLLLIDPSYEVKDDYSAMPRLVADIHRKWNVGVIALWYPVLAAGAHLPMRRALDALALPKTLLSEIAFPPARPGHGMTGSGLFVVNAPFGLADEAARLAALFARL